MRKNSRNRTDASRARGRELRRDRSVSERVLWVHLRKGRIGFRFRTQVRVGPYYLDFYCAEAALCVEVDGEQHLEREEIDAARDAYLRKQGIETLRLPSLDLFQDTGLASTRWLRLIEETCQRRLQERKRGEP